MHRFLILMLLTIGQPVLADGPDVTAIVETHVVPGYERLADTSATLAATAQTACIAGDPDLETAYHAAFDAWVGVSHLRFGPSETDQRAFALAFWPDPRGSAQKTLATLLRDADPVVEDPAAFQEVSVAARGFYALEFLLFDAGFAGPENPEHACALIQAISIDIATNAAAILADWSDDYAALMTTPGNETYRNSEEAAKQLFTALSTGLEFTSQTRLGRPLGTFDRPRPARAEARRSGRSLRHVALSLESTRALAAGISAQDPAVAQAFDDALERAAQLDDPVFAGVAKPQGRLRVEALQTQVEEIRGLLALEVGPRLGIAAGFNSLDGD